MCVARRNAGFVRVHLVHEMHISFANTVVTLCFYGRYMPTKPLRTNSQIDELTSLTRTLKFYYCNGNDDFVALLFQSFLSHTIPCNDDRDDVASCCKGDACIVFEKSPAVPEGKLKLDDLLRINEAGCEMDCKIKPSRSRAPISCGWSLHWSMLVSNQSRQPTSCLPRQSRKWRTPISSTPRCLVPTKSAYSALVPNARVLERALARGVRKIAVVLSATETTSDEFIGKRRFSI